MQRRVAGFSGDGKPVWWRYPTRRAILAEIFKTTLDELVSQTMPQQDEKTPLYHSETSYDIENRN